MSQAPVPEYSYPIDLRQVNDVPLTLVPDEAARRRLAGRFGITAIPAMQATVQLMREGERVTVTGRLVADVIQACRISAEDFPVHIDEPVLLRFVPPVGEIVLDEEIELTADACDEIEYEGSAFDLGEALAQTLALAIDPFAEGPNADTFRAEHGLAGETLTGPFAALAALKKQD
ncbi:YceD family protein [Novosphingobium sp.]|uniref:YceD family protein n=1 Tax=Novosphingobium sp. TaxID=1874826 RepID=UPI003BAC69EA